MPIVNSPEKEKEQSSNLVDWLMPKLEVWRTHRDNNYKDKWNEYYRLWRGIFIASDKNRKSERSQLIAPALQQAIEASVSEIEEATFSRGTWFDTVKDPAHPEENMDKTRDTLKADLHNTVSSICDVVLISALYGTGIGEILIEDKTEVEIVNQPVPGTFAQRRTTLTKKYSCIKLNPVLPNQFLIDPSSPTIEEGLGCAVEDRMSKAAVVQGIRDGIYNKVELGSAPDMEDRHSIGEATVSGGDEDKVKIVRYYGKIPRIYLDEASNKKKSKPKPNKVGDQAEYKDPEWDLVESIVIIANDRVILKATENPYFYKDRPVIAFQWDRVPKKFWGRGVAEKGYNPQKALDAELRARIDALALITHPMVAMDATKLPRGSKFEVYPGATVLTNGNPNESLMPFKFGDLNPATFTQSGDMERMVQMATGAMDSAAPIGTSPRNATSGGMSMMLGGSIKRAKRSLLNFQNNFLVPFIEKSYYRLVQFEPDKYPVENLKFTAVGTLGIMAREYEQQMFIQLLSVTPKDSPIMPIIIKGIMENSSISSRDDLIKMIEDASKPDPAKAQAEQEAMQAETEYKQAQTRYLDGQLKGIVMKTQMDAAKLAAEHDPERPDPQLQLDAHKVILDDAAKQRELSIKEKQLDLDAVVELRRLQLEYAKLAKESGAMTDSQQAQISQMIKDLLKDLKETDAEEEAGETSSTNEEGSELG